MDLRLLDLDLDLETFTVYICGVMFRPYDILQTVSHT